MSVKLNNNNLTQKFKFTSAVEKFVVVFMIEDELMFAEIRNFPTEKDLWEAEILFNSELINNIVIIATEEDFTWDKSKLTKEQRDIILQDVRNTYFKKDINQPARHISLDSLKCSCIGSDIKQEIMASNLNDEIKRAFSEIRTCSDPIDIKDFIQIMHSEASKIYFASRPIIYKVRDVLTTKLGITDEEFNKYLHETVELGWVNLIEGSPLRGKESDWYDIAGRRFYYFEFIPDWKRKQRDYRADGILKFESDLGLK